MTDLPLCPTCKGKGTADRWCNLCEENHAGVPPYIGCTVGKRPCPAGCVSVKAPCEHGNTELTGHDIGGEWETWCDGATTVFLDPAMEGKTPGWEWRCVAHNEPTTGMTSREVCVMYWLVDVAAMEEAALRNYEPEPHPMSECNMQIVFLSEPMEMGT